MAAGRAAHVSTVEDAASEAAAAEVSAAAADGVSWPEGARLGSRRALLGLLLEELAGGTVSVSAVVRVCGAGRRGGRGVGWRDGRGGGGTPSL